MPADPARVKVVAHRGASAQWPEHTRAAMLQAIADGADGIECDVRLTADDRLVCWHDPTVDRTSDGRGSVRARTLAQLRELDVVSWHGGPVVPAALGGPRDQVLTLEDLLDIVAAAGRPIDLAIELKHPAAYRFAAEDAVLEVLAGRGWDPATGELGGGGRVSLMSFHPGAVRHLRRTVGAPVAMCLLDTPAAAVAYDGGAPATRAVKAAYVRRVTKQSADLVTSGEVGGAGPGVDYVVAFPDRVRGWVEAGRLVRVWTVDTAEDLAAVLAVRAHEVTTNVPAKVVAMLAGATPSDESPAS
ncbi:glycerophosphodiester phosphodiesterase family protein [Actinotalea fermentans]|uniref:Putative glycerophosphoryl diester phosphodiesterase n=1 Tax=Actinotalea fermentans TaxID=43671 RepID=A0A511YVA3_9CELL|nr:glycerophosphodiester phosphodiesterase family protein [Actinotalea fermentans]KGM16803.1 hypothetical protein N867_15580 [Actinotalea fermentans ATCC 43279 = JCM 9966 = DSM 3133]GEN79117.1 putative glycerophosphoryl diester phosphodiesterase [Actinotalea fermentans]